MNKCKIIKADCWVFYLSKYYSILDENACGKWMYFFNDVAFAKEICEKAITEGICYEAKHSNSSEGVCCFYVNGDDAEGHRRIITFMIQNNLIRKTKTGRFYDLSFKYDQQTNRGEYGDCFEGSIKLNQFIDLSTGKWKN